MTTYSGTTGLIKVGANTAAEMDSWDITADQDLIEITSFGDTGKRVRAGFKHWSGKASGRFYPGDTAQMALINSIITTQATISLIFQVDSTIHFDGTAWVKSFGVKDSATGLAEIDFTFEGDGAITLTTA